MKKRPEADWQGKRVLYHREKTVRSDRFSTDVHVLIDGQIATLLILCEVDLLKDGKETSAMSVLPTLLEACSLVSCYRVPRTDHRS